MNAIQTGSTKNMDALDVEDARELVELIKVLPRDRKLIIYGQVIAHASMAGVELSPEPSPAMVAVI
jgi:hypothetical protein